MPCVEDSNANLKASSNDTATEAISLTSRSTLACRLLCTSTRLSRSSHCLTKARGLSSLSIGQPYAERDKRPQHKLEREFKMRGLAQPRARLPSVNRNPTACSEEARRWGLLLGAFFSKIPRQHTR